MYVCKICHFLTEFDDVVLQYIRIGKCVCLRCFDRELGYHRPMSKQLQDMLNEALKEIEALK